MLMVRQQKHQEALKFLTQAVEADSKNYMAHYYYASMLQTVGDDAVPKESRFQLMKQHLKKSIELAPDYPNAYDMLGYVALVLREELPETEELVKKALALSPNRRSLRLRLAELMVANNEAIAARALVTPLINAEEDSIREQARSLLDGIQKYVDNLKAFEEYQQRRLQAEAAAAAAEALSEKIGDNPSDRPTITRKATGASDENRDPVTVTPQIVTRPVGQQLDGALLSLDCTRGLTLRVRAGNGVVELHSDDPSKIEFVSYTTAVSNTFTCGALTSPLPVTILYRRSPNPRYLGEPLRIEFPDKK